MFLTQYSLIQSSDFMIKIIYLSMKYAQVVDSLLNSNLNWPHISQPIQLSNNIHKTSHSGINFQNSGQNFSNYNSNICVKNSLYQYHSSQPQSATKCWFTAIGHAFYPFEFLLPTNRLRYKDSKIYLATHFYKCVKQCTVVNVSRQKKRGKSIWKKWN